MSMPSTVRAITTSATTTATATTTALALPRTNAGVARVTATGRSQDPGLHQEDQAKTQPGAGTTTSTAKMQRIANNLAASLRTTRSRETHEGGANNFLGRPPG